MYIYSCHFFDSGSTLTWKEHWCKEHEQLFWITIKIPSKYNTVLLGVNYVAEILWSCLAFFVQVKSYKDVLFKVSTGEIESSSTIKCFNKTEDK